MEDTPETFLINTRLRFVSMINNADLSDDTVFVNVIKATATLGMTQKQVAKALNVTPETVQRWVKAQTLPGKSIYRTAYIGSLCNVILN